MEPRPASNPAAPSIVPSVAIGAAVALVPSLLSRLAAGNQMLAMVVGVLSCLAMVAGGAIAAVHFAKKGRFSLTTKDGAWLGLYVGLATFAVSMLLLIGLWLGAGMPSFQAYMAEQMQRSGQEMTAEQQQMAQQMMTSPIAIAMMVLTTLATNLGLPTLGGLLGASMTRSKTEPTY